MTPEETEIALLHRRLDWYERHCIAYLDDSVPPHRDEMGSLIAPTRSLHDAEEEIRLLKLKLAETEKSYPIQHKCVGGLEHYMRPMIHYSGTDPATMMPFRQYVEDCARCGLRVVSRHEAH